MKLNKDNFKEIIAKLTPEQKAKFFIGIPDVTNQGLCATNQKIEELGIPMTVFADGPQGLRFNTPTICFPCATLLAQTWDDELIEECTEVMGEINKAYGVDLFLAPGMNIQRYLLNGRNFEYFSEDPLLTGHMAASYVNGVQKTGVGSCIKHYCANSQERYRNEESSEVFERALREIYLRAFGYAIKHSDPYGLMTSYNRINGTYAAVNKPLVKDVLRDEFGYRGVVTSDWTAGGGPENMMKVTNDMYSGTSDLEGDTKKIQDAIESGEITDEQIEACLTHVFDFIIRTNAYTTNNAGKIDKVENPLEKAELVRKVASDGIVLLKNDGALPFAKGKVSVFGNASFTTIACGNGSGGCGTVNPMKTVDAASFNYNGITVNSDVYDKYKEHFSPALEKPNVFTEGLDNPVDDECEIPISFDFAKQAAENSDIAIFTIARRTAEGTDNLSIRGDYLLNDVERDALTNIGEAFHALNKKVIVAINSGNPIETKSWDKYADAIIYMAYPGEQAGFSLFDIITGTVNPSGKLACTWPVKYGDIPQIDCYPGSKDKACYCEDIYVGYRYYETFNVPVMYPFGYGLSYTDFEYSDFTAERTADDNVKLTLKVTNTGKTAGRETAQFYVTIPDGRNEHAKVELCGYKKTKTLAPGESCTVTCTVTDEELQTYVTDGAKWIREGGVYKFSAAKNAHDIIMTKDLDLGAEKLIKTVVNVVDETRFHFKKLSKI